MNIFLISITMVTYNDEKYLKEQLDSIYLQKTLDFNKNYLCLKNILLDIIG